MRALLFLCMTMLSFGAYAEQSPEAKIKALGITLTEKGTPAANYVYAVQTGNLLFTAGHIPKDAQGNYVTGKLGKDLTVKQGQAAARMSGISLLSTLKQTLGDLNRVKRIVKVTGMVNAAPEFTDHSSVINGFSDLMVEVFGEKGKHARSAVGMSSLPVNAAVEIEMIVEIE